MAEGHGQEIAWLDELVAQVRDWHNEVLAESGGAAGEHTAQLIASCARPFQTAFGEHAFPSAIEQAAALFHGIITSHAFVDGNKRTSTIAAFLFLIARGVLDGPTPLQVRVVGEVAVETASGNLDVHDVAAWFDCVMGRASTSVPTL